jgi:hypothetical protein
MVTASNEAMLRALPAGDGIKIGSALTQRKIVQMLVRSGRSLSFSIKPKWLKSPIPPPPKPPC